MGEEVDLARQPFGGLEDGLDGGGLEEGHLRAHAPQQVGEVGAGLVARERRQVVADDDPLVERLMHGHAETAAQLGLPAEEQAEPILRVHGVVGEQAHLLEHIAAQAVGLVEDEHGAGARFGAEAGHLVLDLAVEGGAVALGGQAHLPGDRLVEVHGIARGQGHVEDLVQAGVEARGPAATRGALAAAAVAGDEPDAAHLGEVTEARGQLHRAPRRVHLLGGNVVAEGKSEHGEVLEVHQRFSSSSLPRSLRRRPGAGAAGCVSASRARVSLLRLTKQLA